ncbi:MAG: SufE family protein, partial [Burkholderiales bacterium]|nr:SufE family protein [Burkholderiales bacterium]
YADSDALIVKGLLAIVIKIFSDKTRIEIQNINFMDIFNQLDLKNHLSQSRSNGLFSVISKIRIL